MTMRLLKEIFFYMFLGSFYTSFLYPEKQAELSAQNWYPNHMAMAHLISTYRVKTVVEVGAGKSNSTFHIASLLPPEGHLFAILKNPKKDSYYSRLQKYADSDSFKNKVTLIDPKIEAPLKMIRSDARPIDLVYIDHDHEYETTLQLLNEWYPIVKGRGILAGDGLSDKQRGVGKAVLEFKNKHNLSVVDVGWFWYLLEND